MSSDRPVRSFRSDTLVYGLAVLLDRVLALLLLPLLTRLMAPSSYGVWTQTLVSAGVLSSWVLFASPTGIVRYFSSDTSAPGRRPAFVRLGCFALLLMLLTVGAIALDSGSLAHWIYGDRERRSLVPALILVLSAEAWIEFSIAWLRASRGMARVSAVMMLRTLLRYAVVALLASGRVNAEQALLCLGLCQQLLALVVLAWTWRSLGQPDAASTYQVPSSKEWLRFSAPLVLLSLLTAGAAYVDRFLLVHWLSLDQIAVYAAAVSLSTLPFVLHSVLGFVLFPVLVRHWQAGERDKSGELTAKALRTYLFASIPMALGLALVGPGLLVALTTHAYRADAAVFVGLGLYALGFGIYQILLYVLLLDGRSGQVLGLAVIAMGVNLSVNLLLIPRGGLSGAGAAAAASGLVLACVASRWTHRVLSWRFPWAECGQILWRSAVALLPLLMLRGVDEPRRVVLLATCGLAAALYLGLDLIRRQSVLRSLLNV